MSRGRKSGSKNKDKKPELVENGSLIDKETMEKTIDMVTGLTLLQKKAAELSAKGLSDPEIGKALGIHFNTVKNWRKQYATFRNIEQHYKPKDAAPLIFPPMTTSDIDNPEGILLRMAVLVPRALETMDNLLCSVETPPSTKFSVAKFITSNVYEGLKPLEGTTNEYLEELKESLARANGSDLSLVSGDD